MISTIFTVSTIIQVVSKRVVKMEQMQWNRRTHHLLQLRTKVLNGELRETFERWYAGMRTDQKEQQRWAA